MPMTKLLIAMLLLSGCAQITEALNKSDEETARFVNQYCDNSDAAFREDRREGINAHAAPDEIIINCAPR
jgi:starvation-inducible outer membrane lipoprotein